jgi:hypothetical protein
MFQHQFPQAAAVLQAEDSKSAATMTDLSSLRRR